MTTITPPTADELYATLAGLQDLTGPSGFESQIIDGLAELAGAIAGATVVRDRIGGLAVTVGAGRGPRIAMVAHVDEIGLQVRRIDEHGRLWLRKIGLWDPSVLPGQRVRVLTGRGPVPGVIGARPPHVIDRPATLDVSTTAVDLGVSTEAQARDLVAIGDPIVLEGPLVRLAGDAICGRALDNRINAAVALELLRRVAGAGAGDAVAAEVVAYFTVREESAAYGGARVAVGTLDPDMAVVLETCLASDTGVEGIGDLISDAPIGAGTTVARGAALDERLTAAVRARLEAAGVRHTLLAAGDDSFTDAEGIYESATGVPVALLSIPVRHIHTPVETVSLGDAVEQCRAMLALIADPPPLSDVRAGA